MSAELESTNRKFWTPTELEYRLSICYAHYRCSCYPGCDSDCIWECMQGDKVVIPPQQSLVKVI